MTLAETEQPSTATALKCVLCRYDKVKVLRKGVRENPETLVYKCPRCLLQFIVPPYPDLQAYYKEQYRKEHDHAYFGKVHTPEQRFRMMWDAMTEPAERFSNFVPKGASVLEIGCSSGFFLDHLVKKGYDVFGAEWNALDAAYVRDVGEIPCEEGPLESIYPGKSFTAIAALQVLEHQPDPIAFLRTMKDRLIPGGYFYLELPNTTDALLTIYGIPEFREMWYREPHITYWQQETLAKALGALGLEAKVSTRQRYGLLNHISWQLTHKPMSDFKQATDYMKFIPKEHPMSAIMNRLTSKLDKEYRVQLETLKASDTIVAWGRRIEI